MFDHRWLSTLTYDNDQDAFTVVYAQIDGRINTGPNLPVWIIGLVHLFTFIALILIFMIDYSQV